MFWLLCWNITSHGSEQPIIVNVQDDGYTQQRSSQSCLTPEQVPVEIEAGEII